jgi:multicomponent Na+:H+ antiporter subunit D
VIFHPALVLILGALLVPLFKGKAKSYYMISLPVIAFLLIAALPTGDHWNCTWLAGFGDLSILRVDKLAKAFGYIFTINATAAFIYAFYVKDNTQHVSSLLYIGSALGAVFAGDLITLYVFWEIMAVASTMLILARRSKLSLGAGFRYILIHVLGGLFLLAGIVITFNKTGSIAFEHFHPDTSKHLGTWLILLGFLVNAAAPPFSAWLSDAYPEGTITGAVILSAYTTKTAVYTLIRGYPGWEILLTVGCIMAVYGIIYALLENDMRRILAYSIINQVGFMVCAVGIGVPLALDGAVAHAFCHIIYKSLLWMSAGAVMYRVGKSKCTDLGGLYKSMPWSLWLGCIGALAISAVPLTSGFTSKTMILAAASHEHLYWPWFILEIASAGVFLHAGIKFPYFVFFAKDRGHRVQEAPKSMIAAMCILAFLCIFIGVYPQALYSILPHATETTAWSVTIDGHDYFSAWKLEKVITQLQLLLLSALTFFVWIKFLKRTDTIVLDTDWFYRRGGKGVYKLFDKTLNPANTLAHNLVVNGLVGKLNRFFNAGPARLLVLVMVPYWKIQGADRDTISDRRRQLYEQTRLGTFPIGVTAFLAVVLLAALFFF